MNRKDIINKVIEEQKKVIESLESSVERYKIASDLDEESTHDPEDFSRQTEAKDMQLRYEKMLRNAEHDLNFLENEIENTHDSAENGSIIETENNFYFVGISVPTIKIKNKEIISFSEDAPIFKNIEGKKAGDDFKMGENKQIILTIL